MAMHCGDARSRKVKNTNAPKKQPQRGLGVAQLEKLRLQEQCKMFQPTFQDHKSSGSYVFDASSSSNGNFVLQQQIQQQHQSGFSWHHHHHQEKENFSNRNMSFDPGFMLKQRDHKLVVNPPFLEPATRPPDLRGRQQEQLELAMNGTPSSIGNKPEELPSFQIYQNIGYPTRPDTKIFKNKRQRVESWLCLDAGSCENKSDISYSYPPGPHFTTGLVRHALESPSWTQMQEKPVMHSACLDKRPCIGLSWNDSLTPSTMNLTSSTSSSRHVNHQFNSRKRGSSSEEPASEVEIQSTFLALGLNLSSSSSESSKSIFHSSEDEDRASNNQNGDKDMDNSSTGSHVQPCWVQIGSNNSADVSLDLNLRLSL